MLRKSCSLKKIMFVSQFPNRMSDTKSNDTNKKIQAPDVFVYHYPCPDGQAARAIAETYFGETAPILYLPYTHGKTTDFSQTVGKKTWFVDVTPPVDKLCGPHLSKASCGSEIHDHHSNKRNRALAEAMTFAASANSAATGSVTKASATSTTGSANSAATGSANSAPTANSAATSSANSAATSSEKATNDSKNAISSKIQSPFAMSLDTSKRVCGALMLYRRLYGMVEPVLDWLNVINKGDTGQRMTADEYAHHCWLTREDSMATPESYRATLYQTATKTAIEKGRSRAEELTKKGKLAFETMKLRSKPLRFDGLDYAVGVLQVDKPGAIAPASQYAWSNMNDSKVGPVSILMFEWINQGTPSVSFRRHPDLVDLDLAEIATRNGGGGHEEASGCQKITAEQVV